MKSLIVPTESIKSKQFKACTIKLAFWIIGRIRIFRFLRIFKYTDDWLDPAAWG